MEEETRPDSLKDDKVGSRRAPSPIQAGRGSFAFADLGEKRQVGTEAGVRLDV